MPLVVFFLISKTDMLVGESPACQLKLRNAGRDVVSLVQPGEGGMPVFRVVELKTGAETLISRPPRHRQRPETIELAPGQGFEHEMLLRDYVQLSTPGDYAISVIYEFNEGRDRAESEPVRMTVKPFAVRYLSLDSVQGATVYGVSINTAADPADVVVSRFELLRGGGVMEVDPVGVATFRSEPVISRAPNTQPSLCRWIAWIDGGSVYFTYHGSSDTPLGTGQLELPIADTKIVPPLHIEPNRDAAAQADGAALVWSQDDASGNSLLSVVELRGGGKTPKGKVGAEAHMAGPRPKWAMSHVRSGGEKLVTFIHSTGGHSSLHLMPWPAGARSRGEPRELAAWDGELVAAGATISLDDTIHVAALVWMGSGTERKLELHGWAIDRKGALEEKPRAGIAWPADAPVDGAVVRVREGGKPAALLRTRGGDWQVWDGSGKLVPAPARYVRTNLPLDLAFFGPYDVVLICAEPTGAFSVVQMDGSGLPPDER